MEMGAFSIGHGVVNLFVCLDLLAMCMILVVLFGNDFRRYPFSTKREKMADLLLRLEISFPPPFFLLNPFLHML